MTIGELKKIIIDNNLQDDAEIFVQIVDASVLSNHGFITLNKKNEHYYSAMGWNNNIDNEVYPLKNGYPHIPKENLKSTKYTSKYLEECVDKYIEADQIVRYKDDNNLYICTFFK
jgi:hypothetical protein